VGGDCCGKIDDISEQAAADSISKTVIAVIAKER